MSSNFIYLLFLDYKVKTKVLDKENKEFFRFCISEDTCI